MRVLDPTLVSVTFTVTGSDWPFSATWTWNGVLGALHTHWVAW